VGFSGISLPFGDQVAHCLLLNSFVKPTFPLGVRDGLRNFKPCELTSAIFSHTTQTYGKVGSELYTFLAGR